MRLSLSMIMLMAIYQNCVGQSKTKKSDPSKATIQRVVCFKFKAGTSPEEIQQHLQGLAALKDSIPYILSYRAGSTIKGEMTENSENDVMHYLTFRNEADIKLYYYHPAHLRFVEKNAKNWEKFFVVNSQLLP